jgi:hypothetical protein
MGWDGRKSGQRMDGKAVGYLHSAADAEADCWVPFHLSACEPVRDGTGVGGLCESSEGRMSQPFSTPLFHGLPAVRPP